MKRGSFIKALSCAAVYAAGAGRIFPAGAENPPSERAGKSKSLVAYFSRLGNTR